jgi:hypothetical protein
MSAKRARGGIRIPSESDRIIHSRRWEAKLERNDFTLTHSAQAAIEAAAKAADAAARRGLKKSETNVFPLKKIWV